MTGAGPQRVLFLGHGAERTGPPILLGHLLAGLARAAPDEIEPSVLVARSGPLVDRYRAAGAAVVALSSAREPLEPLAAALRRVGSGSVAARLQDRRRHVVARRVGPVDLVWVNAATPPTAALLRALDPGSDVPVVVHVHELGVGLRRTLDPADLAFLLDRADHLVAASEPVARLLSEDLGVAAGRITTCAEFVDVAAVRAALPASEPVRRELEIPADAAVVGSVGLPDRRKDPDQLLRAVHRLRRTRPDLDPWVVWVGGEPDSADGRHLVDEAHRLGLADRLRHVPHDALPARWLPALDVFALPAREDALPLAALEAGAAGLPIVCFRTGGVAGLCDAGAGTAVAYPDVDAFADALGSLLGDPDGARAVGAVARSIVEADHDLAPGTARILDVLRRWRTRR